MSFLLVLWLPSAALSVTIFHLQGILCRQSLRWAVLAGPFLAGWLLLRHGYLCALTALLGGLTMWERTQDGED
jgi:hypothetical protein